MYLLSVHITGTDTNGYTKYLKSVLTMNASSQHLATINMYTQYLHQVLSTYTKYLHSALILSVYSQRLHSVLTLSAYTQYLHLLLTLNTYIYYSHSELTPRTYNLQLARPTLSTYTQYLQ